MSYSMYRPGSLAEALDIRRETAATPFAGGTDLMVRHRGYKGTGHRIPGPLLFLDRIDEIQHIRREGDQLVIGAAASLSDILAHPDCPPVLAEALELHAAPAIRNRATLGGNIANASPAADSVPPLLVLDARLTLSRSGGERRLDLSAFATGPGRTVLDADELITDIRIPAAGKDALGVRHYYRKAGTRRANALSRVSLAGLARIHGAPGELSLADFRFAFGAVGPTVFRIRELEEAALAGADIAELRAVAAGRIRPIDDQRSTADYRRAVALNALEEFLGQLAAQQGETP
jgi:CO/xanthine dehydrogenase FAD-binding subunit